MSVDVHLPLNRSGDGLNQRRFAFQTSRDVALILEHAARVGEGRHGRNHLVWKPVPDLCIERDCAAAYKQDALKLCAAALLTPGFAVNDLDNFTQRCINQVGNIVGLTKESHRSAIHAVLDGPLADLFQGETGP